MTVWTCNVLYKHHAAGDMRPRLWGDDDAELLTVLYGCGASLDDRQPNTSWENYLITPAQQLVAVELGAVVTDWLEPRYQRALAEGDLDMCLQINRTREHTARPGLRQPLLKDPLAQRALADGLLR